MHVVIEKCRGCTHGDSVDVCPVSCFYTGIDTVVINGEDCIDCDVCETACPESAIINSIYLTKDQRQLIEYNQKYALTGKRLKNKQEIISYFKKDHSNN